MSNPISNISKSAGPIGEPDLEVDEILDASEQPILDVDPVEESAEMVDSEPLPEEQTDEASRGSRMGLVALVLGALLLASLAINVQQARVTASLDAKSQELETALAIALERGDLASSRADAAESTLASIGSAVDSVNDRIASLQEALQDLRGATER